MLALANIRNWLRPAPGVAAARRLYDAIMAASRDASYFIEGGVADTTDGRFDLVLIHLILVLRRLKSEGVEGKDLGQRLFDVAFANFDEALRELGVGDLSVPKKMRKLAEAFYGRVEAYEKALGAHNDAALDEALKKNLYRAAEVKSECIAFARRKILAFAARLDATSRDALLGGTVAGQTA